MSFSQVMNNMKLEFNQRNADICDAIEKLPISDEYLPLYFEILLKTESPLIWGCLADLLAESCEENPEFKEIILHLLEDDKTKGARGYLLNAVRCIKSFDKRTIDILIKEVATDNYECRNKASDILSVIYESSDEEVKEYIRNGVEEAKTILNERIELLELE